MGRVQGEKSSETDTRPGCVVCWGTAMGSLSAEFPKCLFGPGIKRYTDLASCIPCPQSLHHTHTHTPTPAQAQCTAPAPSHMQFYSATESSCRACPPPCHLLPLVHGLSLAGPVRGSGAPARVGVQRVRLSSGAGAHSLPGGLSCSPPRP